MSKLCGTITTGEPPRDRVVRVVPPELLRTLPDWHALVIRMNLSPVVVRFRPAWKRPERRFPLSLLRPRPALLAVPRPLPLPLPETVPDDLGAMEPAAREFTSLGWPRPYDELDLAQVPGPCPARPWDEKEDTGA